VDRQTDRQTDTQTDRHIDRYVARQTDMWLDRQTYRQTNLYGKLTIQSLAVVCCITNTGKNRQRYLLHFEHLQENVE